MTARAARWHLLLISLASAAWVRVAPPGRLPHERYGHAAAVDASGNLLVSHGYNLLPAEAGSAKRLPQWLNDTWSLPYRADAWRATAHTTSRGPTARYGHSLVVLADGVGYLFGGDDGGSSSLSSYTGGRFYGDVWALSGLSPAVRHRTWRQLSLPSGPTARSYHACVAATAPTVMVCFGGLTRGADAADGLVLEDSAETWVLSPAAAAAAAPSQAVGDVVSSESVAALQPAAAAAAWRLLATGDSAPPARHGHSMAYSTRVAIVGSGTGSSSSASGVHIEHSVWLFGGVAMDCPSSLHNDADIGALFAVVGSAAPASWTSRRGEGATPRPPTTSCQLGDTWRLTWSTAAMSAAAGGTGMAGDGEAAMLLRGVWQRIHFPGTSSAPTSSSSACLRLMHSSSRAARGGALPTYLDPQVNNVATRASDSSYLDAWVGGRDGAAPLRRSVLSRWAPSLKRILLWPLVTSEDGDGPHRPYPRTHAAMGVSPSGNILLHGGGDCAPGCSVLGDTWVLRLAPVVNASSGGDSGDEATPSTGRPLPISVNAADVCAVWERHEPVPERLDVEVTDTPAGELPLVVSVHHQRGGGRLRSGGSGAGSVVAVGVAIPRWLGAPPTGRRRRNDTSAMTSSNTVPTSSRTSIDLDGEEPHKRYRHSLSGSGAELAARTVSTAAAVYRLLSQPPPPLVHPQVSFQNTLISPTMLFGGESFLPNRYFNDLYAWIDDDDLQALREIAAVAAYSPGRGWGGGSSVFAMLSRAWGSAVSALSGGIGNPAADGSVAGPPLARTGGPDSVPADLPPSPAAGSTPALLPTLAPLVLPLCAATPLLVVMLCMLRRGRSVSVCCGVYTRFLTRCCPCPCPCRQCVWEGGLGDNRARVGAGGRRRWRPQQTSSFASAYGRGSSMQGRGGRGYAV